MTGRWLTAEEAAAQLRISPRVMREKATPRPDPENAGRFLPPEIRASKPGGRWLFEQADLDEYVARGANTTDAPTRRRRRRAA